MILKTKNLATDRLLGAVLFPIQAKGRLEWATGGPSWAVIFVQKSILILKTKDLAEVDPENKGLTGSILKTKDLARILQKTKWRNRSRALRMSEFLYSSILSGGGNSDASGPEIDGLWNE